MGKNHVHRWEDKIVPGWHVSDSTLARVWLRVCRDCNEGYVKKAVPK